MRRGEIRPITTAVTMALILRAGAACANEAVNGLGAMCIHQLVEVRVTLRRSAIRVGAIAAVGCVVAGPGKRLVPPYLNSFGIGAFKGREEFHVKP